MKWFKVWTQIIYSPDILELTATQRWVFITILALASDGEGIVHRGLSKPSQLAHRSSTDARKIPQTLAKMQELGLINVGSDGSVEVCKWYKYQSTTAERQKRRERQLTGELFNEARQSAAPDLDIYKEDIYKEEVERERREKERTSLSPSVKKISHKKAELKARAKGAIGYWQAKADLPQHQGSGYGKEMEAAALYRAERNADDHIRAVIDWYEGQLADNRTWVGGNNKSGKPWRVHFERVMKGGLSEEKGPVFDWMLEQALWGLAQAAKAGKIEEPVPMTWEVLPPRKEPTVKDKQVWAAAFVEVKKTVGHKEIDTWFGGLRILCIDGAAWFTVPNVFYRDFIADNYVGLISAALEKVGVYGAKVYFGGADRG